MILELQGTSPQHWPCYGEGATLCVCGGQFSGHQGLSQEEEGGQFGWKQSPVRWVLGTSLWAGTNSPREGLRGSCNSRTDPKAGSNIVRVVLQQKDLESLLDPVPHKILTTMATKLVRLG